MPDQSFLTHRQTMYSWESSELAQTRWLILCVNVIGLRNVQLAGKTWFLGVSLMVFLEDVSIWISRLRKEDLSKEDLVSRIWYGIIQYLRPWIEQKCTGRVYFFHSGSPSSIRDTQLMFLDIMWNLKMVLRRYTQHRTYIIFLEPLVLDWTISPVFLDLSLQNS